MKHCPDCKSKKKHNCLCHQIQTIVKNNKDNNTFLVFEPDDFSFIMKYAERNGFVYADKVIKNGKV